MHYSPLRFGQERPGASVARRPIPARRRCGQLSADRIDVSAISSPEFLVLHPMFALRKRGSQQKSANRN